MDSKRSLAVTPASLPAATISELVVRPSTEFKCLPGRLQGGSSPSIQLFEETTTRTRWVGKCGMQAMYQPAFRDSKRNQHQEEYREWLGLALYRLLGVPTPDVALSLQLPVRGELEMMDYSTPCLHLMSKFIEGFQTYGAQYELYVLLDEAEIKPTLMESHAVILIGIGAQVKVYFVENKKLLMQEHRFLVIDMNLSPEEQVVINAIRGKVIRNGSNARVYDQIVRKATVKGERVRAQFLENYRTAAIRKNRDYVEITPAAENVAIPLKGFGAMLSVACFLYDLDCVGNSGGNVGYVVEKDMHGRPYAKTIKIDPGYAFSFLDEFSQKKNLTKDLIEHKVEYATGQSILRYDELSIPDQKEFAETAQRILQTPQAQFEAIINQAISPQGLTTAEARRLTLGLMARKNIFLVAYSREVSRELRLEIQVAREALLAEELAKRQLPKARYQENENKTALISGFFSSGSSLLPLQSNMPISLSTEPTKLINSERKAAQLENVLSELQRDYIREEDPAAATSTPCRLFQVPVVSAHFTGREVPLTTLADIFHAPHKNAITQGIAGLGGSGKTQLAARYAERAARGEHCGSHRLGYRNVIWLHAQRDLTSQWKELAEIWFGIKNLPPAATQAAVDRELCRQRTLIVLDNIEEFAILKSLWRVFTSPHYHILLTSRDHQWQNIPTLKLNGFDAAEGQAYVGKQLPGAKAEEVSLLLEATAALPLALSHAVAYIRERYCTLAEYPQQFGLHQLSLGGTKTTSDSGETVVTTFLLTMTRLLPVYPAVEALLIACAYFAPENIPLELLFAGLVGQTAGRYPLVEVQRGIKALIRHALLQPNSATAINIHRLVQGAIRSWHHQKGSVHTHLFQWMGYFDIYLTADRINIHKVTHFIPHMRTLFEACSDMKGVDKNLWDDEKTTLPTATGKLVLRPQADFKALPRPRPSGAAFDLQYLEEVATQAEWLGKCDIQAASLPKARATYKTRYYDEYKELLGLLFYRLLGIPTPDAILSPQNIVAGDSKLVDVDYRNPCIHLLFKVIENTQLYGEDFIERYLTTAQSQRDYFTVVPPGSTTAIPLKGLGAVLAVAVFLYDLNCVGRLGGNVGYVVAKDAAGHSYAQTVKLEASCAFSFLEEFDDKSYEHSPSSRQIFYASGARKGKAFILSYHQLTEADKREFTETAQRILETPRATLENIICQMVCPEGLSQKHADHLLNRLIARQQVFLETFAQDIINLLRNKIKQVRASLLTDQERLAQAILTFIPAMENHLKNHASIKWHPQAASSFVGGVVSAFAKGITAYEKLLATPEEHSIPAFLVPFIRQYVAEHPELRELVNHPVFARSFKNALNTNKLEGLRARFGMFLEEKSIAPVASQTSATLFSDSLLSTRNSSAQTRTPAPRV